MHMQIAHSIDNPSKSKLHRSISFSEFSPRRHSAIREQLNELSSDKTLIRQYSCEELKFTQGTSFEYSRKVVSEIFVPLTDTKEFSMPKDVHELKTKKRFHKRSNKKDTKRLKLSYDHVPTSIESANTEQLKLSAVQNIEKKTARKNLNQVLWIVLPLLVILFSVVGTQIALYKKTCDATMDIKTIEYFLSSNIFGQENAVKDIVQTLKKVHLSEKPTSEVLIFTGPTGVGKTYTVSLLEELFPWPHNIHHWVMPIDFESFSRYTFKKFPFCGDHLVIVDDLTDTNIEDAVRITNFLSSRIEQKNVIAIFIVKLHKQFSDVAEDSKAIQLSSLNSNFKSNGIIPHIIQFKTLEEKDVIQCIKESLTRHWLPVTDESVQRVLKQIHYTEEGCKRINSKLAVLNDLWARDV